jgi:formylglycine-generating enzyme required for sulfatase activity
MKQESVFQTLLLNSQGQIIDRKTCTIQQFTETLGHGITLEMIAIPGGTFLMGAPKGESDDDERPQHEVTIPPFFMGKYPVTQEQWKAVMGSLPPCRCPGDKRPIDRVSWEDAVKFCQRLSNQIERSYNLPSEAQWEYACRAGTTTPFYFGETLTADVANYNGEFTYWAEPKGIYRHEALEVGSLPPNTFGLYNMHGTIWEWCADPWHPDYTGAPTDGSVWEAGGDPSLRIVRGGSWHDNPQICRSATRLKLNPAAGEDFVGFRIVTQL